MAFGFQEEIRELFPETFFVILIALSYLSFDFICLIYSFVTRQAVSI